MIFKSLSLPDLEQVRLWRNDIMASLRTPFLLTEEMQEQTPFSSNVIPAQELGITQRVQRIIN